MTSKKFGDAWVFYPIACVTGAAHMQPRKEQVRLEACTDFTDDYSALFDARGALDAPETIPLGGVRAQDFSVSPDRLLIGHMFRDGWSS